MPILDDLRNNLTPSSFDPFSSLVQLDGSLVDAKQPRPQPMKLEVNDSGNVATNDSLAGPTNYETMTSPTSSADTTDKNIADGTRSDTDKTAAANATAISGNDDNGRGRLSSLADLAGTESLMNSPDQSKATLPADRSGPISEASVADSSVALSPPNITDAPDESDSSLQSQSFKSPISVNNVSSVHLVANKTGEQPNPSTDNADLSVKALMSRPNFLIITLAPKADSPSSIVETLIQRPESLFKLDPLLQMLLNQASKQEQMLLQKRTGHDAWTFEAAYVDFCSSLQEQAKPQTGQEESRDRQAKMPTREEFRETDWPLLYEGRPAKEEAFESDESIDALTPDLSSRTAVVDKFESDYLPSPSKKLRRYKRSLSTSQGQHLNLRLESEAIARRAERKNDDTQQLFRSIVQEADVVDKKCKKNSQTDARESDTHCWSGDVDSAQILAMHTPAIWKRCHHHLRYTSYTKRCDSENQSRDFQRRSVPTTVDIMVLDRRCNGHMHEQAFDKRCSESVEKGHYSKRSIVVGSDNDVEQKHINVSPVKVAVILLDGQSSSSDDDNQEEDNQEKSALVKRGATPRYGPHGSYGSPHYYGSYQGLNRSPSYLAKLAKRLKYQLGRHKSLIAKKVTGNKISIGFVRDAKKLGKSKAGRKVTEKIIEPLQRQAAKSEGVSAFGEYLTRGAEKIKNCEYEKISFRCSPFWSGIGILLQHGVFAGQGYILPRLALGPILTRLLLLVQRKKRHSRLSNSPLEGEELIV